MSMTPTSVAAAETPHDSHGAHAGAHQGYDVETASHDQTAPCTGDCTHDDAKSLAGEAAAAAYAAPLSDAVKIVSTFGVEFTARIRSSVADFAPPLWRGPPGDTLVTLKIRLQN